MHILVWNQQSLSSIYIWGGAKVGKSGTTPEFPNEVTKLNLLDKKYSQLTVTGVPPPGRYKHQTIVYKDALLILGGTTNANRYGYAARLDLIKNSWSSLGPEQGIDPKKYY
jgi:hypothetical protein